MTDVTHPTLLRIDASARLAGSTSRRLADGIESRWKAQFPRGTVIRRDLAADPISHITDITIQGFYTPPDQLTAALRAAIAHSDSLIAELKSAHTVLISTPIYNFALPSALKAWIDQIVRVGHSFAYEDGQFRGLVKGPRAVLALAYGAGGYQGPMAAMDFLRPYLSSLLNFIGIAQVQVIAAEATTADAATAAAQVDAAEREIQSLFTAT